MNKKTLNEVVDPLKTDTASIADPHLKSAFIGLLNLVDILSSENEELKVENQPLKNEVNILKGELGKPTIKPKSSKNKDASAEEAPKDTNISAEKERKEDSNDNE